MRRCALLTADPLNVRSFLFLAVVILVLFTTSAAAQAPRRSSLFDQPLAPMPSLQQPPAAVGNMIFGGLIGGAIGFFGGGFAGALLNDSDDGNPDDLDALAGFVVGAIIGETVTLPLGVHLANKRRGNYGASLLASAAITAIGLALASHGEDHVEYVIPVPIAQLAASIAIEQKTTR